MPSISSNQVQDAMNYAIKQIGHPYLAENPQRFGPHDFDCSGLVWTALRKAGVPIPGGPSNPAAAIVDPELQWLAKQPGASVITDPSKIQAGDFVGFQGADPPGNTISVGGHKVSGMGHIGIATSSTTYVSAYDTAEGVVKNPIKGTGGDTEVIAVRPSGGGPASPDDGSTPSGGDQLDAASFDSIGSDLINGVVSGFGASSFEDLIERAVIIGVGLLLIVIGVWRWDKK
jgi:hypothetical protein